MNLVFGSVDAYFVNDFFCGIDGHHIKKIHSKNTLIVINLVGAYRSNE